MEEVKNQRKWEQLFDWAKSKVKSTKQESEKMLKAELNSLEVISSMRIQGYLFDISGSFASHKYMYYKREYYISAKNK